MKKRSTVKKSYYELSRDERRRLYEQMKREIHGSLAANDTAQIEKYAADTDTYIRKNCYLILGRLFRNTASARPPLLKVLDTLSLSPDAHIRQTIVFALGEIGKYDFGCVAKMLEALLNDPEPAVQNGITGAVKQAGEKNPGAVITWAERVLKTCNSHIRAKIIHGLELRGRKHPEDILPLLMEIDYGRDKGLRKMLVHIIGQISYKKGCLEKVALALKNRPGKEFTADCKAEIINVHKRYRKFSYLSPAEAEQYLARTL